MNTSASPLKGPMKLGWWLPLPFIVGGLFVLFFTIPIPDQTKERALCDRAVTALLHSNDLVEVTRAGIIIRQLNCDIGRRL